MPAELIEIAAKAGAGLVPFLLFLWWTERTDRKSAEKNNAELSREMIEHIAQQKELSRSILTLFGRNQA
jgi:hypothetical protein